MRGQITCSNNEEYFMACKLMPIAGSSDFESATGEKITLFVSDHIGNVLIAKAEYGGKQLVPAGQATSKIELDVASGRATLKLVFVFTASVTGRGELREDCSDGDSHFVRDLAGDEPLQLIKIVGK